MYPIYQPRWDTRGMGEPSVAPIDSAAVVSEIHRTRFLQWGFLGAVGLGLVGVATKAKNPWLWAGAGVGGAAAAVYLFDVTF